jgi:myo-inositol-1(or 4)-monophosphatase
LPGADVGIERDAALLDRAVREAGALALRMFRTELRQWIKGKSSPVSEADIAVDELLRDRLQSATSDYGWLSEESVDDSSRLTRRRVWIVDPIDGTRAYLEGREDWSVSAALVEDGQPLLGAVFAPATDEFFFARRGDGASRNGATLAVAPGTLLNVARIAGPRFLLDRIRAHQSSSDDTSFKIGSLALRLARVAEGRLEAAFAGGNSHDWDLAAAHLLIAEAGGALTTLQGAPLRFNRQEVAHQVLVGAGLARHERLLALFASP